MEAFPRCFLDLTLPLKVFEQENVHRESTLRPAKPSGTSTPWPLAKLPVPNRATSQRMILANNVACLAIVHRKVLSFWSAGVASEDRTTALLHEGWPSRGRLRRRLR